MGYQIVPKFVLKIIQLFDTFCVRFGVMIVGPTGGGKTTCYEILQDSMSALRKDKRSENEMF
jgi:dynein heavy chain, axonemal